jgi:hypothetical protein
MQGHFFTWEKSLITDYGLPGTIVLYLRIVGFLQWQGCVTGVTTQLHHGTRTWQILEQKCNLKIHHLKESIHCKSLYSQGIRQCPYEVAKIVKLGWLCPANAEYFLLVFFWHCMCTLQLLFRHRGFPQFWKHGCCLWPMSPAWMMNLREDHSG